METPLTLVVPLRLAPGGGAGEAARRRAALGRLDRLLAARAGAGVGAVVADDTEDAGLAAKVEGVVARHAGARRIAVTETRGRVFSIGRLRDLGAEAAPEGFVLFHDVDFAAPPAFWPRLRAWLAAGEMAAEPELFACLPVWFLNRAGGLVWRGAPGPLHAALARDAGRRGAAARLLADRLVMGSSAMLMRRALLIAAGGHSPRFEGHGAEDFELMHRLAARRPRGAPPEAYWRDFGSRDRGRAGFRAYFARYAEGALAEGLVMAHLWHPRRREDPRYYARRRENFALLEAELRRAGPGGAGGSG